MIKFTKLGTGEKHTTKTGKKCIRLNIKPELLMNVPKSFMGNSIYIFPNDRQTQEDRSDYTVFAQVDSTGQTEQELRDMSENERKLIFADWIFSPDGQKTIVKANQMVKKIQEEAKDETLN